VLAEFGGGLARREVRAPCNCNRLDARVDVERPQDAPDVIADSVDAELQLAGDLAG
jgi:hypothetical protein